MKQLTIAVLLFLNFNSFSQGVEVGLDYLDVQDSLYNLTCGEIKMEDIIKSRTNLENFDPSCITKNKQEYYRNLGFSNYISYAKTMDSIYLNQAITAYNNAILTDSTEYNSLWDLSLCYMFGKQYVPGLALLERYKITVPKKHLQKKEYKRHRKYFRKKLEL